MTLQQLLVLPLWMTQLVWSLVVVLMTYLIGRVLTHTVCQRLAAWAAKTPWKWDELIVDALRRGIPFWSLLLGMHLALGIWPMSPALASSLSRILFVLIWCSVTFICAGLAGDLIALYGTQFNRAMPMTSLTQYISRIIIVVLGLLMILNGLGISITPLLTALGVGGLAVALALQDTLSNLFAGIYLTMAHQIRLGDYVKLETGQEGYVEDIGWRATTIRMLPNNMVIVPNNKLGQAIITNYYMPNRELAVLVEVGVDYASDLTKVERVTCEIAKDIMQTVTGGVPTFVPVVRYHTFGESSINFTVILRANEFADQYLVTHEFIKRLHARYDREGIVIPFPVRTVYMKTAST